RPSLPALEVDDAGQRLLYLREQPGQASGIGQQVTALPSGADAPRELGAGPALAAQHDEAATGKLCLSLPGPRLPDELVRQLLRGQAVLLEERARQHPPRLEPLDLEQRSPQGVEEDR